MFRMNFGFREYWHKIGVSCPSWNDMIVNMLVVTRASTFSKIKPYIKTVRSVYVTENLDTFFGEFGDFQRLVFIKRGNASKVAIGRHHKVTIVIWENIHDNKAVLPLEKNKIFFIIAGFW